MIERVPSLDGGEVFAQSGKGGGFLVEGFCGIHDLPRRLILVFQFQLADEPEGVLGVLLRDGGNDPGLGVV